MRPRLVHPTVVEIERVDRKNTKWDPDFRSTGKVQYEPAVRVRAQVGYVRDDALQMIAAGDSPQTIGHITMLRGEYNTHGGFGKGDHIVGIGGLPADGYITEIRPVAMSGEGQAQMVRLDFSSRRLGP